MCSFNLLRSMWSSQDHFGGETRNTSIAPSVLSTSLLEDWPDNGIFPFLWYFVSHFPRLVQNSVCIGYRRVSQPQCFQISAGIPHLPRALPSFVALMASNSSLLSGFSSTSVMFGLCAMMSKAEPSTSPVMLSSWSNWFANLSRVLAFSCIAVSPSRTVRFVVPLALLWPIYFSQAILKGFHVVFICCLPESFSLPPLRFYFPDALL